MASIVYTNAVRLLLSGGLNLTSDTLKVMLVDSGYTPDKDHDFVSSASGDELSGTGYTAGFNGAGRKTLASKTFTANDTGDFAYFDAADSTWSAINAGTINRAIVIKEVTDDTDSILIACLDSTSFPLATNGGDITLSWNASGLVLGST